MFGNILVFVGSIVGATSNHIGQSIAAHVLLGFGGGNCQIAAFALPELLPNRWRHWAVVLADAGIYFDVIVGPVVARIAYANMSVSVDVNWTASNRILIIHPSSGVGDTGQLPSLKASLWWSSRCSTFLLNTPEVSHGERRSKSWTTLGWYRPLERLP